MNTLFVKEFKGKRPASLSEVGLQLDSKAAGHPINLVNWKRYPYNPKVDFKTAYSEKELWIKFRVQEKYILALETKTNGEVYKDSCVEFFISFDGSNYYNFEFSCIGTIHLAYGPGRENRRFVNPEIIKQIEVKSSLGNKPFAEKTGNFNWELISRIPVSTFAYDKILTFKRLKATANFYKCGDGTSEPHYLSWNPVGSASPDFHRPEFFGEIYFE